MAPPKGNADTICTLLLLKRSQLTELSRHGHIPPPVAGMYDPVKTVQAYVAHLQDSCAVPRIVTAQELGAMFGMSREGVMKLVHDHGMPRKERGKYDAKECIRWYIAHQRKRVLFKQESDLDQETLMLKRAQRKKAEIEQMALEREFVPATECRDGWITLASVATRALQALHTRLGHSLTPEQRELVKRESKLAQQQIADDLRALSDTVRGGVGRDDRAGAGQDAGPVGEPMQGAS
jgi:phage terminase Nu1 subunit (DNA packaging protein)